MNLRRNLRVSKKLSIYILYRLAKLSKLQEGAIYQLMINRFK
jgi:hypothetical protein